MPAHPPTHLTARIATARQPGAIGIVQVHGPPEMLRDFVQRLCGIQLPDIGAITLARFADIDQGVLARPAEDMIQLMPHAGLRVVQRLLEHLTTLEVALEAEPHHETGRGEAQRSRGSSDASARPTALYPEAEDEIEARMLHALARAQSPAAIDLLLQQPQRWRAFTQQADAVWTDEDEARSQRLNRLIDPPLVVLAGPANVGKSTLSNALLGRSMSIAIDMPGTTRDYTAGRIDLAGLVVWWHDTPGLRDDSDDAIERESIRIARDLMQRADLLIALTDHTPPDPAPGPAPGHAWPLLPRQPDLRIANKSDMHPTGDARPPHLADADLCISATTGEGLADLVHRIRAALIPPADLQSQRPWRFDPQLTG